MATDKPSAANNATLEARIAVLEELFVRLAQAGATETILDHGFKRVSRRLKTVSERLEGLAFQMEPLRSLEALAPQVPDFRSVDQLKVDHLLEALAPGTAPRPAPPAPDPCVDQLRSAS